MDLFTLSCKYGIPIILAAQSNRAGGENKEGPGIDNIAESDAIAQNATRVITMRNDTNAKILTLRIAKNRYGNTDLVHQYDIDFSKNKYKPIISNDYVSRVTNRNSNANPFKRVRTF